MMFINQKNIFFDLYTFINFISITMIFSVYSKDGCPFCSKIIEVLKLSNLNHKIYKLGEDFGRDEFYDKFGYGSTFPQVTLNDIENLGGCTDTVKYLQEKNLV